MNGLFVLAGLLWGYVGFAQSPQKPAEPRSNQDAMPVLRSQGGLSTMPVVREKGNALPMPNSYVPPSPNEANKQAMDALQDQLNRFKNDSAARQERRTQPVVPKKEKP